MTIELNHVTKRYGKNYALDNINICFQKGKIYGLIGPNGSGKSTLLKLISGLVTPNKGNITINGEVVTRKIAKIVAYLTELDMFHNFITVEHMIEFYTSQFTDFNIEKANQLLIEMKLDSSLKIKHLSKGNRARLKLMLTLSRNAPIVLLDEPFSGLDPIVREAIAKSLLSYINFEEQIVIIATHEINEIETLLDEVIAIYHGSIIGNENVEAIREKQGLSILNWFKTIVKEIESGGNAS